MNLPEQKEKENESKMTTDNNNLFEQQLLSSQDAERYAGIYKQTIVVKERKLPTDWYESKKILMPASAALPGYVTYKNTPYWREPLNCISPDHPARDITIMGPAQDGKTFMVLEPMIGYTIECNPGNILHLTGNSDLSPDASLRVDQMIDNCQLRRLINPAVQKLRNNRTGDTAIRKEFSTFTYRVNSITKKNALRQNDIMVLILDDADAAKKVYSGVGNIWDTARGRTKAFEWKCKRVCTSSPEERFSSLIVEVFERSDKRLYFIPCPCCHEFITLLPTFKVDEKETAGLIWKLDNFGRVDPKSVGYICQKCAGFFDEENKLDWMNDGRWEPQCVPQEIDHYGYKKSGLLAPPGMTSWTSLANGWVKCNPENAPRIEAQWQTYVNIQLGEPYDQPKEEISATELMANEREYPLGTVPEELSKKDGNGEIVVLTLTADVNGKVDDARIDWSVIAWAKSGATYLVDKGSFGSFVPYENAEARRKRHERNEVWSYELKAKNSVWPEFDKKMAQIFLSESGRKFKVFMSGIDTGYLEEQVYNYIDHSNFNIVGLKGEKESALVKIGVDVPIFKPGKSRPNLFLVQVNLVKNDLAGIMRLKWKKDSDEMQPFGYMNFPKGCGYKEFYQHFESEHKVEDIKNGTIVGYKWEKKTPTSQNHFFDVTVYQYTLRDILLWRIFKKDLKVDKYSWVDFVALVIGNIK